MHRLVVNRLLDGPSLQIDRLDHARGRVSPVLVWGDKDVKGGLGISEPTRCIEARPDLPANGSLVDRFGPFYTRHL